MLIASQVWKKTCTVFVCFKTFIYICARPLFIWAEFFFKKTGTLVAQAPLCS